MTVQHATLGGDQYQHAVHRWAHADAAARLAQSTTSDDYGKISWQLDDNSTWLFTSGGWKALGGGSSTPLTGIAYVDANFVGSSTGAADAPFADTASADGAGFKTLYLAEGGYGDLALSGHQTSVVGMTPIDPAASGFTPRQVVDSDTLHFAGDFTSEYYRQDVRITGDVTETGPSPGIGSLTYLRCKVEGSITLTTSSCPIKARDSKFVQINTIHTVDLERSTISQLTAAAALFLNPNGFEVTSCSVAGVLEIRGGALNIDDGASVGAIRSVGALLSLAGLAVTDNGSEFIGTDFFPGSAIDNTDDTLTFDQYSWQSFVANGCTVTTPAHVIVTGSSFGTYANRPAAGSNGALFTPSDGPVRFIDDGSAWRPLIADVPGDEIPAVASWTGIGTGLTFTDLAGTISVLDLVGNGGNNIAGLVATKTNPCTAILHVCMGPTDTVSAGECWAGIIVRDSSGGRVEYLAVNGGTAGAFVEVHHSATLTSGPLSDAQGPFDVSFSSGGMWLKFVDDGTHFFWYWSPDKFTWILLYSETRAHYVPSGGNQIGIFAYNQGPIMASYRSWKLTS